MINDSEYVDLLVQIVQSTTSSGRPHITAAALGETLQRAVSDRSWRDLGYRSLSELLRSTKVQDRLEVFNTDKGALAVRLKELSVAPDSTPQKEYNRLKKAVWGAFVMATPTGKRFLNKKTGAVRSGLQASPVPFDEWAEIAPIPVDKQKGWAEEFLADAKFPIVAGMREALHQSSWNHAFSTALGPHAADWNRYRSSKVAAVVDAWSSSCGIPHDLVFQSHQSRISASTSPTLPTVDLIDKDREIILAALSTLSTERLREIALPAGALLSILRKH